MVESILRAADVAAATGGTVSLDSLNKLLASYNEMLNPAMKEEREKKAKKVEELLNREIKQGPFTVIGVSHDKRKDRRLN